MNDLEGRPISGAPRSTHPRWITFELDQYDHLHVRTLNGSRVIKDPKRAKEILDTLNQIAFEGRNE